MRRFALIAAFGLLLGACGSAEQPTDESEQTPTTSGDVVTTVTVPPETSSTSGGATVPQEPPSSGVPATIVDKAVASLAAHLSVPTDAIEVIDEEAVTWPDAALGCPEPGMAYAQVLVDGSRVVLGHEGRVYVYHSGSEGDPFLCSSDEKDGGYDFVPPPGFDQ